MNDSRPIGVFDSGIGGLTVAAALRRLLPHESIVYLGDTARVPYGGKSAATVERYSLELADILLADNCKAMVVACNTASALALPALQRTLPVPVLGVIEPGAAAAVAATRSNHVGVIGTRATIRSGAYEKALRLLRPEIRITVQACPLLVPLIEEGRLESDLTNMAIAEYLEPLLRDGVDTLVLGCTHYPLLAPALGRAARGIQLVDSAQNCAAATERLLRENGLSASPSAPGRLQVALTDPPDHFLSVARDALRLEIGEVALREVLHPAKA